MYNHPDQHGHCLILDGLAQLRIVIYNVRHRTMDKLMHHSKVLPERPPHPYLSTGWLQMFLSSMTVLFTPLTAAAAERPLLLPAVPAAASLRSLDLTRS